MELAGHRLQDERLGEGGEVYLCDSYGVILASGTPQNILVSKGNLGLQFQYIWDLSAAWAPRLKGNFPQESLTGEAPADLNFLHEDTGAEVSLSCLPEPHHRFCV